MVFPTECDKVHTLFFSHGLFREIKKKLFSPQNVTRYLVSLYYSNSVVKRGTTAHAQ